MSEGREMLEGISSQSGCCRFCGQIKVFHTASPWSQEKLDEWATRDCECSDGRRYGKFRDSEERANDDIEALFGTQSSLPRRGIEIKPGTLSLMKKIVAGICAMELGKCDLTLADGVKASISVRGNGTVKIQRTVTEKEEND